MIWDRGLTPHSKEVTKVLSAIKGVGKRRGGNTTSATQLQRIKVETGVCMEKDEMGVGVEKTIHMSPRPTSYTGYRQSLQPHYLRH